MARQGNNKRNICPPFFVPDKGPTMFWSMESMPNMPRLDMEDDPHTDVYSGVIKKLQDGGVFSLADIEQLKYHEMNNLFDEIKHWSVYGNKDSGKLRTAINTLSTRFR